MCGIVGVSFKPVDAKPKRLSDDGLANVGIGHPLNFIDSALLSIAHRGPDDSGIFKKPKLGIGMGHRRLSILDPSPMAH